MENGIRNNSLSSKINICVGCGLWCTDMFMTMDTAETGAFFMLGKLMFSLSCKVGGTQSYQMKDDKSSLLNI